jgi:hypothetical protein
MFHLLLACLALAAARPVAAQVQPPLPSVNLTDGRVLYQVQINGTMHDYVIVKCTAGIVSVPYEAFPPDLRAKLEAVRPKLQVNVIVTGDVAASVGPSNPGGKNAQPTGPQNFFYPGRVYLPGPTAAGIPLPAVLVYAVRPADFAAFNQDRQKQYGAAINAAADKMIQAAPGDARKAAITDTLLTIYASFEPGPKSVAMAMTDDKGHFTLSCHELQVVLVARTTVPMGNGYRYMVWAVPATQGEPTFLTSENVLTP